MSRITAGLAQDRPWARELRKAYRPIGTFAVGKARDEMRQSGDRRLAASARALRSAPTPTAAAIRVSTSTVPHALADVYGMKGRSGWNLWSYTRPSPGVKVAVRALGGGRPQHPEWVGNDWTPATRGQGPRGLNNAMADHIDEIGQMFLDAALAVVIRAFPPSSLT